jgi:DNA polymerase-3 subunit delta'
LLLQGPRGIGKQQLALWLARLLLCENANAAPCGACKACKMANSLQHPDLHWYFPRPRLKDGDPDLATVRGDNVDGIMERLENDGVYEAPGGDQGLYVATIRAVVQTATMSPAMGQRKVFIIGDADRMVAQEGSDQAANAFLKLLEEPPADTTIILTSSEPGALLPTIRSRVVSVRVPSLSDDDVRAFLADPAVAAQIDTGPRATPELIQLAGGAPGRLIGQNTWQAAITQAHRLLDAATSHDRGTRLRVALGQGASGARGKFSDTLDALTVVLHERSRTAARNGAEAQALGSAKAIEHVERAKELANGNVNPQLVTASLLRHIAPLVK